MTYGNITHPAPNNKDTQDSMISITPNATQPRLKRRIATD